MNDEDGTSLMFNSGNRVSGASSQLVRR
jgi:hypothetical protein